MKNLLSKASLPLNLLLFLSLGIMPASMCGQDSAGALQAADNDMADSLKTRTVSDVVIVTGYKLIQQSRISSASSVVDGKLLNARSAQNFTGMLQGIAPGLSVSESGEPGDLPEIFIRGITRFTGNSPLILVDGVPVDDIQAINPYDIDKLVVLKDGEALAIYGARGMNGVIEITTRKGTTGLHISYNFLTGYQMPGNGPTDLLGSKEYADLQWLVYANDGYDEYHPIYGPSSQPAPQMPPWAADTDWYNEITAKASVNVHQITFNGGNEHAKFLAGFGYHDQDGLLIHTYSKRYSVRFNTEWSILDNRITLGENFSVTFQRKNDTELLGYNPVLMGPYRSQPIIPVYITEPVNGISHLFEPGDFGGTGITSRLGNSANVVADLIRNKDNYLNTMYLSGNAFLRVQLIKGLDFSSTFGGTYSNSYGIAYSHATYERGENRMTASFREQAGYTAGRVWTQLLRYRETFGNHYVQLFGGYESLNQGIFHNVNASRSGYFSDAVSFRTLSNGSDILGASSNFGDGYPLRSLFFGLHYTLKDKYILCFNLRRDRGISYFKPEGSRIYTGISAKWRIGQEEFLKNIGWINELAIRGSYGSSGNVLAGFEYVNIADIGIEGILFRHFDFVVDWYRKNSQNLLMAFEVSGSSVIYINSGSMENTGIDMKLGFHANRGQLGFHSELVFTGFRNKVTGIGNSVAFYDTDGSQIGNISRTAIGKPVTSFFGYRVAGLFADDEEVSGAPAQIGAAPGFFRFDDLDPDNEINPDDRGFLGNPHPDFTLGINLGLSYQRFDLSTFLYWSQGNEIFNFTKWWTDFWPSYQGQKSKRLLYESWTEENKQAKVPKASNTSNFSNNTQICSYYVEDGSYLRMKSLQVGYRINEDLLKKIHISSLRIYAQAVNLFTLTKYLGLDPETASMSGIDFGSYPNLRQVLVGLQINI